MTRQYSAEYKAVLNSPAWRYLRSEALQRAQYKCAQCGRTARQARCPLDAHHATGYALLGNERVEDLLVLCRYPCHERAHSRPGYGRFAWRLWLRRVRDLFKKG